MGSGPVGNSRKLESVKALLSRSSHSALGRVAEQRQAQADWRKWLENRLPDDVNMHVTGVVEREDVLTIFADSAVWSARLRYAIAEIDTEIRVAGASVRKVVIRVMPRS